MCRCLTMKSQGMAGEDEARPDRIILTVSICEKPGKPYFIGISGVFYLSRIAER